MNQDFVLFLQARLDSSRLALKALLELAGETVITQVMRQFNAIECNHKVLLCDSASAEAFTYFTALSQFELFSGPKDDVLARFAQAAKIWPARWIIRATGDNPLVYLPGVQACMDACLAHDADHCRMDGLPHGSGIEIVRSAALLALNQYSTDPFEREHVCPGIWRYPERYRLVVLQAPKAVYRPTLRSTIDTLEDYQNIRAYWGQSISPDCADFCRWGDLDEQN